MAGSLNQVQLIGNLGKDPEIRSVQSGDRVANFSVACGESWKDKNTGEKKEKTEWVNVVVWGNGLVDVIEKYVKKGSRIFVTGQFRTRKYEKDGVTHYNSECVVQGLGGRILLLGDGGGNGGNARAESQAEAHSETAGSAFDGSVDEDLIPF